MIHDETELAALLDGALDRTLAAAWDEHLVDCDDCWRAITEARRGRAHAYRLEERAPQWLRVRITEAIAGTDPRPPHTRRQRIRLIAVATSVLIGLAASTVGVYRHEGGSERDPAAVAAVLRLAGDDSASLPAPQDGIAIGRVQVRGVEVVVARSDQAFAMPAGAIALTDTESSPWLARRGAVSLLCYSHPAHVLLAGRASPERLTEVARALGISPP